MRYIRTKDGKLFDLKKIKDEIKNNDKVYYHRFRFKKLKPHGFCGTGLCLEYTAIGNYDLGSIKAGEKYNLGFALECDPEGYRESDDITELCDRFVLVDEDDTGPVEDELIGKRYSAVLNEFKFRIRLGVDPCEMNLYGAIRTDKGIIYVAKLNEKGELEVLR